MSDILPDDAGSLEIAVEFRPVDSAATELLKATFADEDIVESSGFSGAELVTIFVTAQTAFAQLLNFFVRNRARFKTASVVISGEKIELNGYSGEEVESILASGDMLKMLRTLKK
jgi:hypothetical protein